MSVTLVVPSFEGVIKFPVILEGVEGKPFVLLGGPNGCGKSTLLKVFVGVLPGNGRASLFVDGGDAEGESFYPDEDRELVRYVPQASEEALFGGLSVADNYRLLCDLLRPSPTLFKEAVQGMGLNMDMAAAKLSVGQRKLMVLEAVLLSLPEDRKPVKPLAVLLDEPFAGLDKKKCLQAVTRVVEVAGRHERDATIFVLVDHGSVRPIDAGAAVECQVREGVTFQFTPARSVSLA